jgi:FkbM family methyltransferase
LLSKIKSKIIKLLKLDYFYLLYINKKYNISLNFYDNKDGIHILREIFSKNAYSSYFPNNKTPSILDIGGHYGFFSIYAAIKCNFKAKIWSLEPSKNNFDILLKNLNSAKFQNIVPFNLALSGSSGIRNLNLGRPQNHSLYDSYIDGLTSIEIINSISLDDFMNNHSIENIDFMKLDCEGSEYEILLNTSLATLAKIKVISMELHDMRHCGYKAFDLINYLESSGFKTVSSNIKLEELKPYFNIKLLMVR